MFMNNVEMEEFVKMLEMGLGMTRMPLPQVVFLEREPNPKSTTNYTKLNNDTKSTKKVEKPNIKVEYEIPSRNDNMNKKKEEFEYLRKYIRNNTMIIVNAKDFPKFMYTTNAAGFSISEPTIQTISKYTKMFEDIINRYTTYLEFHFRLTNNEIRLEDVDTNDFGFVTDKTELKPYDGIHHPLMNFKDIYTFDFLLKLMKKEEIEMDVKLFNAMYKNMFHLPNELSFMCYEVDSKPYYVLYPKKQFKNMEKTKTMEFIYPTFENLKKFNELLKQNGFPTCFLRTFVFETKDYPTIETFGFTFKKND